MPLPFAPHPPPLPPHPPPLRPSLITPPLHRCVVCLNGTSVPSIRAEWQTERKPVRSFAPQPVEKGRDAPSSGRPHEKACCRSARAQSCWGCPLRAREARCTFGRGQHTPCGGVGSSPKARLSTKQAQRFKGKQGRFRGNLYGKRVDVSGRTALARVKCPPVMEAAGLA